MGFWQTAATFLGGALWMQHMHSQAEEEKRKKEAAMLRATTTTGYYRPTSDNSGYIVAVEREVEVYQPGPSYSWKN